MAPSLPDLRKLSIPVNPADEINLVGDEDQLAVFHLPVAASDPGFEPLRIQLGRILQSALDGVDDEMKKIGLIGGIAARMREDNPVG
jgi:hypothetical protein